MQGKSKPQILKHFLAASAAFLVAGARLPRLPQPRLPPHRPSAVICTAIWTTVAACG